MVAIIIALLSSPVVLWFLTRLDKNNTEQHTNNMTMLKEIHRDLHDVGDEVKTIRKDLFDHIAYHAHSKEADDGNSERRSLSA